MRRSVGLTTLATALGWALVVDALGWNLVDKPTQRGKVSSLEGDLDVEIVAPFMLLHNSKFNTFLEYCERIISWFHHYFIFLILFILNGLLISVFCRNVALMITDSQKCKWKFEYRENREKKKEKLDISISNYKIRFLNFPRFIVFTIFATKMLLLDLKH